jgi:nucleotide-binding universal stress UspA family protein
MISKILLPLDGSTIAETALEYAEALLAAYGAELTLVTATGRDPSNTEPLFDSYLQRTVSSIRSALEHPDLKVDARILQGSPADEILRFADAGGFDLIVMSSRGATGAGPWQLGSITIRVAIASSCPVLVVKKPAPSDINKQPVFRRILVPLDGSAAGEAALPLASDIARIEKSQIILFYAIEPAAAWAGNVLGGAYATMQEPQNAPQSAADYLDNVCQRLAPAGIDAVSILESGPPAETIINYSKREQIDLIAISTHGRSGITRWVLGSVTEKVLAHSTSNVLVVHAGK